MTTEPPNIPLLKQVALNGCNYTYIEGKELECKECQALLPNLYKSCHEKNSHQLYTTVKSQNIAQLELKKLHTDFIEEIISDV